MMYDAVVERVAVTGQRNRKIEKKKNVKKPPRRKSLL